MDGPMTIRQAVEVHACELAERLWGSLAARSDEDRVGPAPEWHIVLVEPMREATTHERLRDQGFAPYVPFFRKSVRRDHFRRRIVTAAMFPGYLFLHIDPAEGWLDRLWRIVADTVGVRDFLTQSGYPVRIGAGALEAIRATERRLAGLKPILPFKVGDAVEVDYEEWKGRLGVIERLGDNGRIRVLTELLGRLTPLEVSVNQVRAI